MFGHLTPIKYSARLVPLGFVSLILIWGSWLQEFPRPDHVFSPLLQALTIATTVSLLFSFWGWGRIGLRACRLADQPAIALTFGLGIAALLAFVTAHLGLLGFTMPLLLSVGCIGATFAEPDALQISPLNKLHLSHGKKAFLGIAALGLFLAFSSRMLQASTPLPHGDPLYYHLLAPVLWLQNGRATFFPEMPILQTASYWEYLYLWPAALFHGPKGSGLISLQISGQWLHLLAGMGTCALIIFYWSRLLAGSIAISLLITLAGISSRHLQWTGPLAKNDFGVAALLLGAGLFLLLYRQSRPRLVHFLVGILAGMALAAKLTIAFFLLPLAVTYLILRKNRAKNRQDLTKESGVLILGILAGMLPLLLRNWFTTGNPFFPVLGDIFGNDWVTRSYQEYLALYQVTKLNLDPSLWLLRFKQLFLQMPLVLVGVLAMLAGFCLQRKHKQKTIFYLLPVFTAFIASLIFAALAGPNAELRLLGPALLALSAGAVLAILATASANLRYYWVIAWIVLLGVLADSRIPLYEWRKAWQRPSPDKVILQHRAGSLKQVLRHRYTKDAALLLAGDNEGFYVSMYRLSMIRENPRLDAIMRGTDPVEVRMRSVAAAFPYNFLLVSTPHTPFQADLKNWRLAHPQLVTAGDDTYYLLLNPTREN